MDSYTWNCTPFEWDIAERIADDLCLPLVAGVVLARRGFASPEEARAFLEVSAEVPSPFLFSDMEIAVEKIVAAAAGGMRVVVHGDYDVDGISATALLVRGLRHFGIHAETYLPSRFVEGYGLSESGVRTIATRGEALLITVDCGVNYPDQVALAMSLGLDVIVTDHHSPGPELPACPVIHASRGEYPHAHLCGVGVALKVLHALHVRVEGADEHRLPEALLRQLDLVALGTVADLVPLVGENRYYVTEGVVRLATSDKPGLRALLSIIGEGRIDAQTIGYRLAPRLNAAGRMKDPQSPLRLLLTDDPEEAAAISEELDVLNRRRQEVEAGVLVEALQQVEELAVLPTILVLAGADWHEGVLGIVASRIVERYHRPAAVLSISDGVARGSARSIPSYDMMAGLTACSDLFSDFGGHRQAAGMTLPAASLEEFRSRIEAHADATLTAEDMIPTYRPDAVIHGEDLTLETADSFACLAPFGMGNPRVNLIAIAARFEYPETTRKGDHLRCSVLVDDIRTKAIGFGLASKIPALLDSGARGHAGLRLEVSEWQGTSRAEAHLHSLYRATDHGQAALGCTPDCPFRDPLDAPVPCAQCAEPFAGDERPLTGRDLRDRRGTLPRIAEVLSSGEPVTIVGSSASHHLAAVCGGLPLRELGVAGVDCVSRYCWRTRGPGLRPDALLFADWWAAERRAVLLSSRRHIIVADPPFRASHTRLVADLAASGARIHLIYGKGERDRVARELRRTVHPRYWMVALYREWQAGGAELPELLARVDRAAWGRDGALASSEDLHAALALLEALGHGPDSDEKATMKATDHPAYLAAEAAYTEAINFCRRM